MRLDTSFALEHIILVHFKMISLFINSKKDLFLNKVLKRKIIKKK